MNVALRRVQRYESPADLETEHGRIVAEPDALEIVGVKIPVAFLFED